MSRLSQPVRAGLGVVLTAIAYYAAARLGYRFAIPRGIVTLWPPSGVVLGLLLSNRRGDWPIIVLGGVLGSITSDLQSGYGVLLAIAAALANATETLVASSFVMWRIKRPLTLSRLRDIGELTLGASVLSNAATATLGALVLHVGFKMAFPRAWLVWWVGDGLGMLIVAPVVIGGAVTLRNKRFGVRSAIEVAVVFIALAAIVQLTLGPPEEWAQGLGPYAAFPLLLWAGLRFGPFGAASAILMVAAIASWNAALGLGPFAGGSLSSVQTAMQTYSFLAVVSLCGLVPAAVVDERESAARRQSESENRYGAVVEAATDAIVTIDAESRIQFANAAVEEIFGYRPDELTGRELTFLMPETLRQRHRVGLATYLATGNRTFSWRAAELTGLHKDGHEIPVEISIGERREGGTRVLTGIIRDITEKRAAQKALRDAEDRMRFAMEASRVGTWEVDFVTGVARWSPMLEALHGLAPGSFGGTYESFLERIHPEDRAQVREVIDEATRQRRDSNIVYRTTWPDGSIHWISAVGRSFYDDEGIPRRAAGIGLDVTERRMLEDRSRQSQKMEAVGQLAGGVAHDFNNLLTVVLSCAALLRDALPAGAPGQADVSEILLAAERATALTRQLLSFSRRHVSSPRPLSLSESLRNVETMLRRLIGEHIDIVIRARSDVGQIVADPGEIEQIILNLALNARDAMPDGGLLTLETANVELDAAYERTHGAGMIGPRVMLAVSDTGIGMDAATAARIFEPFFTTKPVGKGTGLGLSMVYAIATQSGGAVAVYTEPGHGTIFRVYFPRVDAAVEPVEATSESRSPTGTETILLVEDDAAIRKIGGRMLEAAGYRVLSAGTPAKALSLLEQHGGGVDLLLTDLILPEMSGRVLVERLAPRFPDVRVLYMSGYTDDVVVRHRVFEHESPFLQKPFARDALLTAVRNTLDTGRS
jgi:PAS domain S-box-containing protein